MDVHKHVKNEDCINVKIREFDNFATLDINFKGGCIDLFFADIEKLKEFVDLVNDAMQEVKYISK